MGQDTIDSKTYETLSTTTRDRKMPFRRKGLNFSAVMSKKVKK